ncbi:MAG: FecR domain-containing protein [Magnetococcales bacterium]|nr:FecR domain-containing protein [Magnetococcales bacterium]
MGNFLRNRFFLAILILVGITVAGGYLWLESGKESQWTLAHELKKQIEEQKKPQPPFTTTVDQQAATPSQNQTAPPQQPLDQRQVVGLVTQVKGLVFSEFNQVKRTLLNGAPVFQGDRLVTGKRGRLIIKMVDDAIIALGPDSEFLIQQYRFSSKNRTGKGLLEMTRGLLKFTSGKLAQLKKRPFHIVTSVATMGVRGTEGFIKLSGPVDDQEIEVITLEKQVVVWMERQEQQLSSSSGRIFSALPALLSTAYAADLTKKPYPVRKNRALTASRKSAPSIKKASRAQLKKALTSTVIKSLSTASREQMVQKVAQSLVEQGAAKNMESAVTSLQQAPEAINELVEAAEAVLLQQTVEGVEKVLAQAEKIEALEQKINTTLGKEKVAEIEGLKRQQQAEAEQLVRETEEKLFSLLGDGDQVDQAREIIQTQQDQQEVSQQAQQEALGEVLGNKAEKILAALAQNSSNQSSILASLKPLLPTDLFKKTQTILAQQQQQNSQATLEAQKAMELALPADKREAVQQAFAELAMKQKQLAAQTRQEIQKSIPNRVKQAITQIEARKKHLEKNLPDLNTLLSSYTTPADLSLAIGQIDKQIKRFSQEIKQSMAEGKSLQNAINQKAQEQIEKPIKEAQEMGVDLVAANQEAQRVQKQTDLPEKLLQSVQKDREQAQKKGDQQGSEKGVSGKQSKKTASESNKKTQKGEAKKPVSNSRGSDSPTKGTSKPKPDPKPAFTLLLNQTSVYANAPIGTVIGFLSVDKPQEGNQYTFSVAGNNLFAVAGDKETTSYKKNALVVNSDGLLSGQSYSVVITATALNLTTQAQESVSQTFTILCTTSPFVNGMTDVIQGGFTSGKDYEQSAVVLFKSMIAHIASSTPRDFELSENDLRTLVLAKLNQQITGSTPGIADITDIISAIGVVVTQSDIQITTRIKALDAIYNRLPAEVQDNFKDLVDTVTPYDNGNFAFDIKLTLAPLFNNPLITYGSGSKLEVLHLMIVGNITFEIETLINEYNKAIEVMSDLTFFSGGGIPRYLVEDALGEEEDGGAVYDEMSSLGYWDGFTSQSRKISSQGIRLDYYLPGKIAGYTLMTGKVVLHHD